MSLSTGGLPTDWNSVRHWSRYYERIGLLGRISATAAAKDVTAPRT